MKRLLSLILATLVGANYSSAGIRITVPQKWKGKTLYIWQTDINQAMKRNADEPVHQVRDTVEIKELTFDIPLKLDVATKVNVMTPKRNEFVCTTVRANIKSVTVIGVTTTNNFTNFFINYWTNIGIDRKERIPMV